MSAQLGNTPPTIDIRNPDELRWWAKELGVSEDQVRGAVSRVGNSAPAVREALQQATSAQPQASGGSYSVSQAAQSWDEHRLLPNRGLIDDEHNRGLRAAGRIDQSRQRGRFLRWALTAAVAASVAGAAVMLSRRRSLTWSRNWLAALPLGRFSRH